MVWYGVCIVVLSMRWKRESDFLCSIWTRLPTLPAALAEAFLREMNKVAFHAIQGSTLHFLWV